MTIYTVVIAKTGDTYSFDTEKLPQVSVDHATDYGFRQSMNDAAASMVRKDYKGTPAEFLAGCRELVEKRYQQYLTGQVPGGRVILNPKSVLAAQSGLTEDEMQAAIDFAKAKKEKEARAPKAVKS